MVSVNLKRERMKLFLVVVVELCQTGFQYEVHEPYSLFIFIFEYLNCFVFLTSGRCGFFVDTILSGSHM